MQAAVENAFTEEDLRDWAQLFLNVTCEDFGIGWYEYGGARYFDRNPQLVIQDDLLEVDVTGCTSFPLATRGIYFQEELEVEYALAFSHVRREGDRTLAVYFVNP